MLNRIKLTNFQRHRALEVTFNAGISALRGSNEAGKSTLIRAICYALFGAKALPMSLAETVTWGEAESTLKVELELSVEGTVYTINRGKSGAEVNYDGGKVTGQNECTAFISKLLKADAGSAAKLMLASQGEIRGALEKGAAETTKLIEQLAEFDQLDNLIELMQERLTLGSPGHRRGSHRRRRSPARAGPGRGRRAGADPLRLRDRRTPRRAGHGRPGGRSAGRADRGSAQQVGRSGGRIQGQDRGRRRCRGSGHPPRARREEAGRRPRRRGAGAGRP